jgi:hypothetical protein
MSMLSQAVSACKNLCPFSNNNNNNNNSSVDLVRVRTIPTERTPFVGEVSVNFCGYRGVA